MAKDRDLRRDQAGVGPDPSEGRRRLVSMDDLDGYSVAKGEPDVRGWEVCTLGGRELGEVEDLLVDPDRGEVVMLEIELRGDGMHAEVPLRSVQIDRKRKVVLVDSGDIHDGVRSDVRARDRIEESERDEIRTRYRENPRDLRYDERLDRGETTTVGDTEETVVERRPMVEEVVVRRRPVDE